MKMENYMENFCKMKTLNNVQVLKLILSLQLNRNPAAMSSDFFSISCSDEKESFSPPGSVLDEQIYYRDAI